MAVPSFHLAPNFRISPHGSLKLGTLVRDPASWKIINYEEIEEIPTSRLKDPFHVEGFKAKRSKMLTGELGIWATFLASDGPGFDIGGSGAKFDEFDFEFDGLDTLEFEPTRDYMTKAIGLWEVKEYFEYIGSKPPVFLVTGVMIARNPSYTITKHTNAKASAKGGANTPDGASSFRAKAGVESDKSQSTIVTRSDDFIVGLKLTKLWYTRSVGDKLKGKNGRLIDEEEIRGALLRRNQLGEEMDEDGDLCYEEAAEQSETGAREQRTAHAHNGAAGLPIENVRWIALGR